MTIVCNTIYLIRLLYTVSSIVTVLTRKAILLPIRVAKHSLDNFKGLDITNL